MTRAYGLEHDDVRVTVSDESVDVEVDKHHFFGYKCTPREYLDPESEAGKRTRGWPEAYLPPEMLAEIEADVRGRGKRAVAQ